MDCRFISILILLCLSSYSSSSFSSYSSSSYSSSLSSILSLLASSEGETEENIKLSPPFFFLSRLLSTASADQDDSADLEPSLLSLSSLLSAAEKEIVELDKEGEGKSGIDVEKEEAKKEMKDGLKQIRNEKTEEEKEIKQEEGGERVGGEDKEDTNSNLPIPPAWIEQIKEKIKEILKQVLVKLNKVFHHFLGYYLPNNSTGEISEECAIDVADSTVFAPVNIKWFVKMFDSWGKIPDGFFWGNINTPGMYEECIRMRVSSLATVDGVNETREYAGRYCVVSYRKHRNTTEREEEREEVLPDPRSGVSLATLGNPLPFKYGTCIPSTCTPEDLEVSLSGVMAEDGLEVAKIHCQMEEEEEETVYTPEDKGFISVIAIFGILAILATIYEIVVLVSNIKSSEVVLNFSLLRNLGRIFTLENRKETGDMITCLPMLRVVTMLWIIICHQYESNATFIANLFDSLTYQEPVIAQIVTNGWLSVDTFFFMAGLVLTFRLVPYLRAESTIVTHIKTLFAVIVRRIVRLAPVILVVALFCASLLRFLAKGPNASALESYSQNTCREHWWKDPLFINNYLYPGNEGDDVNDCLSHCWYTAVDVQLLVLLPVIFLPAVYNYVAGVVVLCVLSVASIAVPLAITLAYDLPASPFHHFLGEERLTYMTHIFMAPWCRMAPWIVGVWTGLLLRTPWARRLKMNKLVVFIGYVIAIVLGNTLVLGLVSYNRLHFSLDFVDKDWKDYPVVAAFYGALARPTWALCVAWVVFTCHTGNAGLINKILSYPPWLPLARLTFIIYIVSPVVQLWWATTLAVPTYFNYLGKLFESSGVFSVSLLLAIILTCLVEIPVISTVNLFLPSPAKKHERAVIANKNTNESSLKEGWNENLERVKVFPL